MNNSSQTCSMEGVSGYSWEVGGTAQPIPVSRRPLQPAGEIAILNNLVISNTAHHTFNASTSLTLTCEVPARNLP